ncbi:MAG: 3-phosphoshikimate 1-carboxyvinyltransferase [Atribacterota bacterium]
MTVEGKKKKQIRGNITVPGDKSITHRAIIFNSIARGESKVRYFLDGLDCRNTLLCMQALGANIEKISPFLLKIKGKGLAGLKMPKNVLDVGNSGTTIRLLSGLLAGQDFCSVLDGDDSIRKRPMKRIIRPLSLMNAQIKGLFHANYAPLNIIGKSLQGIDYTLPVASAQVKSAILLAGLFAKGETIVRENQTTRDHTERMLALMQANIQSFPDQSIRLIPGERLKSADIDIPGDISSAAYFIAAGCAREGSEIIIRNVGINPTRTGFLEVLKEMGANIQMLNQKDISNEPRADILVKGALLKGIQIDKKIIANIIDELPLVAVIATLAQGKTVVKDAQELRVKESDRIKAIVEGMSRMGAHIIENKDGFEISGPTDLYGNTVNSFGDHRIAMSLAVAASYAEGKTVIRGTECINISYPDFMAAYQKIME